MKRNLSAIAVAVWAAVSSPSVNAADLSLQCSGQQQSSTQNCTHYPSGQMSCSSTPTISQESLFVRIEGDGGRVQIPVTIFKVKGDGWVTIDELEVGAQLITGKLTLSAFTKPRMKIDRYAGTIDLVSESLLGSGFRFSGVCRVAELDRPKF